MRDAAQALNLASLSVAVTAVPAGGADPGPSGDLAARSDLAATGWAPLANGDAWALEDTAGRVARLYRELFPAVFGFVRFRVGDGHLAEDITAMVFERALAKLASVRDPARVRAWLF